MRDPFENQVPLLRVAIGVSIFISLAVGPFAQTIKLNAPLVSGGSVELFRIAPQDNQLCDTEATPRPTRAQLAPGPELETR